MINRNDKVAVCSRSFSKNSVLRKELLLRYEQATFNDKGIRFDDDALIDFLKGHDKAIIALEVINENVISSLPDLKVISKYGVGLDMISIDAMQRYGIQLGWKGGVNRRSVSELVISFSIALLRHVPAGHRGIINGIWKQHIGGYLSGRTVGIIGCGNIGKDLVKLLQPFGCPVLVNDIRNDDVFYAQHKIQSVDKEELLARSDLVTLHVPLDQSTQGMLSAERLALMKPEAVLINAARGGLIDEYALKQMLITGKLAAAGFDVFSIEPPQDQELLELPNFLATPHIGGSTQEAILSMGMAAINGLDNNSIPGFHL